jgi:hypothetical protein
VCVLHIAQDKYGKSFEDCDSKERQSVGGTKVCNCGDMELLCTRLVCRFECMRCRVLGIAASRLPALYCLC